MLAIIWFSILSPLAGEIDYQANRLRGVKEQSFARTKEDIGMMPADEYYAAVQLPGSY